MADAGFAHLNFGSSASDVEGACHPRKSLVLTSGQLRQQRRSPITLKLACRKSFTVSALKYGSLNDLGQGPHEDIPILVIHLRRNKHRRRLEMEHARPRPAQCWEYG
jgi:hypothetical protein